jgi:membrane protein YqaA with SNARE-associated domain
VNGGLLLISGAALPSAICQPGTELFSPDMTQSETVKANLLQKLYDRVLEWAGHPRAPGILSGLSFAESSFFPIPPDVMLAPMCLAQPSKGWRFAFLCTVSSVAGGLLGYVIGRWAFSSIEPWLMSSHYAPVFDSAVQSFDRWGFLYVLLAGFTPIPYKVFTISAGVVGMPLLPFVLGSTVGRGARFFLVAGLINLMGDQAAARLRVWVDRAGWTILLLTLLAATAWWYFGGQK